MLLRFEMGQRNDQQPTTMEDSHSCSTPITTVAPGAIVGKLLRMCTAGEFVNGDDIGVGEMVGLSMLSSASPAPKHTAHVRSEHRKGG